MRDQKDYEAIYEELIGFTPPRIRHRIRAGLECDPKILDMVEALRDRAMYPKSMDVKTAQMILFAVLLSHVSPAAEFLGRGAMRAGATKKELHDVAGLAFLFRGLPAFNLAAEVLNKYTMPTRMHDATDALRGAVRIAFPAITLVLPHLLSG